MGIRGDQVTQIGTLLGQGKSIEEIATTVGLDIGDVQSVLSGATRTYVETLEGGQPTTTGGGATPGGLRVIKFDLTPATPGIGAGVVVFTPAVGDVLCDAWFDVDTAWNGTTPHADLRTDGLLTITGNEGFFQWFGLGAVDLSQAGADWGGFNVQPGSSNGSDVPLSVSNVHLGNPVTETRTLPFRANAANPLKVFVTQDGNSDGLADNSTAGAATLFIVVASPATA